MIVNNKEAWLFDHNRQEIVGLTAYADDRTFRVLFGHRRLDDAEVRAGTMGTYEFQWPEVLLDA